MCDHFWMHDPPFLHFQDTSDAQPNDYSTSHIHRTQPLPIPPFSAMCHTTSAHVPVKVHTLLRSILPLAKKVHRLTPTVPSSHTTKGTGAVGCAGALLGNVTEALLAALAPGHAPPCHWQPALGNLPHQKALPEVLLMVGALGGAPPRKGQCHRIGHHALDGRHTGERSRPPSHTSDITSSQMRPSIAQGRKHYIPQHGGLS